MMLAFDRIQEHSTLIGTGAITLAGAVSPSLRTFGSAFADGDLVGYVVLNLEVAAEWEKGIGTYSAAPAQIARTYVTGGSNGTQPVNFSAGDKLVLNVAPAATVAVDWSPSAVYVPGDTVQDAGTLWYALNVNVGSEPSLSNSNWAAMGGGSGGTQAPTVIPPGTLLGNNTGASSAPIALTATQAKALLSIAASDVSGFVATVQATRLDQLAAPTAEVDLNSQRVTNLSAPSDASDAANKSYVDAQVQAVASASAHLAGPGLVLNVLTNIIRLAVAGDVQIAGTSMTIPDTGTGSVQLQATGGQPPFTWTSVPLPAGISLAADGTLSYDGTQTAGTTTCSFTVTDSIGQQMTQSIDLAVGAVIGPRYWRVHASQTSGAWNEVSITELVFKDASGALLTSPSNAASKAFATSINRAETAASKAFDSDTTTYWMSQTASSGEGVGQHAAIGWDFGVFGAAVKTVTITGGGGAATGSSRNESPSAFTVETSNDKATWTVAGSFTSTGWADAETRTFNLP